jgi:hypothetical protein
VIGGPFSSFLAVPKVEAKRVLVSLERSFVEPYRDDTRFGGDGSFFSFSSLFLPIVV